MSMPNIPDINPNITITRLDVINLILASIGLEELALSHILNAEGEKIQAGIGTATTIDELISIDDSVVSTLKNVIKKEMLLQFKLEDTLDLIEIPEVINPII